VNIGLQLAQGGGGGGGNWLQLISIIAVVGLSALSWIFQKLAEQAQKKKQRDLAEKRELEHLRTGREHAGAAASSPQVQNPEQTTITGISRQQELAAKRQAQLEELRRRQQDRLMRNQREQSTRPAPVANEQRPRPAQRPQRAAAGGTPPIVFIPGSSGPIVVTPRRPGPPQRPVPAQRPVSAQRPGQPPRSARPAPAQRPSARQRPQQRPIQQQRPERASETRNVDTGESDTHRLLVDSPVANEIKSLPQPGSEPIVARIGAPKTSEEWRKAIIARELLAPPLAVRPPSADPLL
jgi:hypothetical protein